MTNANPTDDQIRQAHGVILFDADRGWQESVGPVSQGIQSFREDARESGRYLSIPVDSTDATKVKSLRERIDGVRASAN